MKSFVSSPSQAIADSCTFEFVTSNSDGGIIYSKSITKLSIERSRFVQITSNGNGGCIHVDRSELVSKISETCFDMSIARGYEGCFYIRTSREGSHSLSYTSVTRSIAMDDYICHYQYGARELSNCNFSRSSCHYSASVTSYYEGTYTGRFLSIADNYNYGFTYRIDQHHETKCITKDAIFVRNNATDQNEKGCVVYSYDSDCTLKNCYLQKNSAKYGIYSHGNKIILDHVYGDILTFYGKTYVISIANQTSLIIKIPSADRHKYCYQYVGIQRNEEKETNIFFHKYILLKCLINFMFF